MGRRSINTTKSGKYMNPTDQARKEARKRELKKNKKQRMMVRQAVLKGKDPLKLLQEMEIIDKMEYNPLEAPKLNEKVLKDKRKKLKETFQRVLRLYEKENLEFARDLKKAEVDYEKKRLQLQIYFEQVKNAERVQLDQIPLPDVPIHMTIPSMIPLPNEIPLPSMDFIKQPTGILKKTSVYDLRHVTMMKLADIRSGKRGKPAGPPSGPPPPLSDSEDEEYDPAKDIQENLGNVEVDVEHPHESDDDLPPLPDPDEPPVKQRKIRFADDDDIESDEEEKDTRLHIAKPKKNVTPLQEKMLRLAGQAAPINDDEEERDSSDEETPRSQERKPSRVTLKEMDDEETEIKTKKSESSESSEQSKTQPPRLVPPGPPPGAPPGVPPGAPPGLPPGLPPGPPPGIPPAMFRPPPLRGGPPGAPPRLLPPGPPPGRPQGLPPGPPPGLPPNIRLPPRLPPGPPGVLPPRMLRPPGILPGVHPPSMPHIPALGAAIQNPNVLSAPPSIMKPPLKASDDDKKTTATIEAKPQIKHVMGDVTRFTPTALKVKREMRDSKGKIKVPAKEEEKKILAPKVVPAVPIQTKTKDDVYDQFMKEMENLL